VPILYITFLIASAILLADGYSHDAAAPKQLGALGFLVALAAIPLLFLNQQKRAEIITKVGRLIIGVAVSTSIAFFAGEIVLRFAYPEGESFSAHVGPLVQRFESDFQFNRYDGPSRGPEASGPKLPGHARLLVQGDSITWGQGIKDEQQLFTARLLSGLREMSPDTEMAVLAYPGREIDDHLEQLKKWGGDLQPDVVVYQWYINDMQLDKAIPPRTAQLWRRLFFFPLLNRHSYFSFFVTYNLDSLLPSSGPSYGSYMANRYREGSVEWQSFHGVFSEWATFAKTLTPNVLVALYPQLLLIPGEPPVLAPEVVDLFGRVYATCMAAGLQCVDLTGRLTGFDDSGDVMSTRFDGHPSAAAHAVIAKVLLASLRSTSPELFPAPRGAIRNFQD
jgi:lysophospholipase L1-like esterase